MSERSERIVSPATARSLVDAVASVPVVVVSPALLVSVTIERAPDDADEIHVHPAGQGYWVARMLRSLGAAPVFVTSAGGEVANLVPAVAGDVELRLVETSGPGGCYVDDRRSGTRQRLANQAPAPLDRHAADDLVALTVATGLEAGLVVVTGSNGHGSVEPGFFTTVTSGLRNLGVTVLADLSGAELDAALAGGVDVLKIADEELVADDGPTGTGAEAAAARIAREHGTEVYLTLADRGAIVFADGGCRRGAGPRLDSVDPRGAGDSFTAALAAGRAAGLGLEDRFRLALAAAATNVLRHGLGSATTEAVTSLLEHVVVEPAGDV